MSAFKLTNGKAADRRDPSDVDAPEERHPGIVDDIAARSRRHVADAERASELASRLK